MIKRLDEPRCFAGAGKVLVTKMYQNFCCPFCQCREYSVNTEKKENFRFVSKTEIQYSCNGCEIKFSDPVQFSALQSEVEV